MPILSLLAKLGLDKTGFDAGLASATKDAKKFGAGLKDQLAGAFGAAAVVAFTRSVIEQGDAIDELASRLNISTQAAQEYALAAELGGGDSELFAKKFEVLREAMSKNPEALKNLGIDAETTQEAMEKLADKIQNVGLTTDETVAFVDLFGKGAGKLVNILGDLNNARTGTLFMSDADIKRLKEADDAFRKLWNNWKTGFGTVVSGAQKYVGDVIDNMFGVYGVPDAPTVPKPDTNTAEGDIARRAEAAKIWMATQDRVAKLEEETAKLNEQAFDKQITQQQRINQYYDERARLLREIATLNDFNDSTGEREAQIQRRIAELNLGIAMAPQNSFKIDSNPLGRSGAFIASSGRTPSWAEQQLTVQKAIQSNGAELLKRIPHQ